MNVDVVVDVGNSRIKWGLCRAGEIADRASLNSVDAEAWQAQAQAWNVTPATAVWLVAGVQPDRRQALADWLKNTGARVVVLDDWQQLPIRIEVDHPERVGSDRLLNAVAALSRIQQDTPAILVDAGSAVTVDWVTAEGAFGGGSIFPGLRLMALALHNHTALLPLVKVQEPIPSLPAPSTTDAMQAGIFAAVVGGIEKLCVALSEKSSVPPRIFLTGGDAGLLARGLGAKFEHWPTMTLEGLRLTALTLG